jgi:hypothetical protein
MVSSVCTDRWPAVDCRERPQSLRSSRELALRMALGAGRVAMLSMREASRSTRPSAARQRRRTAHEPLIRRSWCGPREIGAGPVRACRHGSVSLLPVRAPEQIGANRAAASNRVRRANDPNSSEPWRARRPTSRKPVNLTLAAVTREMLAQLQRCGEVLPAKTDCG